MLHRAKKQNPDAVVVAVGCYVQTAAEEAENTMTAVDIVIGNNKKHELIPGLLRKYEEEKCKRRNRARSDRTSIETGAAV